MPTVLRHFPPRFSAGERFFTNIPKPSGSHSAFRRTGRSESKHFKRLSRYLSTFNKPEDDPDRGIEKWLLERTPDQKSCASTRLKDAQHF